MRRTLRRMNVAQLRAELERAADDADVSFCGFMDGEHRELPIREVYVRDDQTVLLRDATG